MLGMAYFLRWTRPGYIYLASAEVLFPMPPRTLAVLQSWSPGHGVEVAWGGGFGPEHSPGISLFRSYAARYPAPRWGVS